MNKYMTIYNIMYTRGSNYVHTGARHLGEVWGSTDPKDF